MQAASSASGLAHSPPFTIQSHSGLQSHSSRGGVSVAVVLSCTAKVRDTRVRYVGRPSARAAATEQKATPAMKRGSDSLRTAEWNNIIVKGCSSTATV
eukprot:IDg21062t1